MPRLLRHHYRPQRYTKSIHSASLDRAERVGLL